MGLVDGIDLSWVSDPGVRTAIVGLLNLIEEQNQRIRALTAENERLRAEICRLKGEPPRPTPCPQAGQAPDLSSERERHEPRAWRKRGKNKTLRIDREEVLRVERASLPPDAEFKGYGDVIVQDLVLRADTICFRKEVWYSPRTRATYRATLPPGYQGQFGPGVKALMLVLAGAAGAVARRGRDLAPGRRPRRARGDAVMRWLDALRPALGSQQRTWVQEALAVAAYQAQSDWPVLRALVTDDAPQFKGLTEDQALCWIHEGRHYKKLVPVWERHALTLRRFLDRFWGFYRRLQRYREHPSRTTRWRLARDFDALFTPATEYAALDDRITKTRAKKEFLLRVLGHPELPLHNNPAELAARQRVRKRAISCGPRVRDGIAAWDTFGIPSRLWSPPPANWASASSPTRRIAWPVPGRSRRSPTS